MKISQLTHHFVTAFPDVLNPGVIYISLEYDTSAHLCACGCGNRVILPLRPTAWRVTYDGETVSFSPSVGNWSFPCRSHYWIDRGLIRWSTDWTGQQVAAGRERDLRDRTRPADPEPTALPAATAGGWASRVRRLLRRALRHVRPRG